MTMTNKIKGYKVFNPNWMCRGFQYEVGKTFEEDVVPKCCERGFHFCTELVDCFNYYSFNPLNKVAEVIALGDVASEPNNSKCSTNKIKIVSEITWEEVLRAVIVTAAIGTAAMLTAAIGTAEIVTAVIGIKQVFPLVALIQKNKRYIYSTNHLTGHIEIG